MMPVLCHGRLSLSVQVPTASLQFRSILRYRNQLNLMSIHAVIDAVIGACPGHPIGAYPILSRFGAERC